jgi:hypothetical protein
MNERSLMVINRAEVGLFSDVLKFVTQWCAERHLEAFVRNVHGGYEIVAKPAQSAPEAAREAK